MHTERRKHQVLITKNTEYHMRDRRCVAVRDRRTGNFLPGHLAISHELIGSLRFTQSGGLVPNDGKPTAGDSLYFLVDGVDLITSPLLNTQRPDKTVVARYID